MLLANHFVDEAGLVVLSAIILAAIELRLAARRLP
jgi:hypothetical protein